MSEPAHHIFIKPGDARREVEALLAELGSGTAEAAGLHKYIYVTRADQTVVFLTAADAPFARLLRTRSGWVEPAQ